MTAEDFLKEFFNEHCHKNRKEHHPGRVEALIIFKGGQAKIIGYVFPDIQLARIKEIIVSPNSQQHKGWGTKLYFEFEKFLIDHQIKSVIIDNVGRGEILANFYKKLGFTMSKRGEFDMAYKDL
ncbi:GNAT family N-acetyltransferase [Candidatus Micrarchaeota archaeon]|nr:GNAT family N-acetyltransferase [Candidatus Micrarchaeota archaeon]